VARRARDMCAYAVLGEWSRAGPFAAVGLRRRRALRSKFRTNLMPRRSRAERGELVLARLGRVVIVATIRSQCGRIVVYGLLPVAKAGFLDGHS